VSANNDHYRALVEGKRQTRFASCGYADRFDPYALNDSPRLRRLFEGLFQRYLPAPPCDRLLDVGCGTGIYFRALAPHAKRIDAIDCSDDMIQVAREYCETVNLNNIHPATGSVESLDWPAETFDTVVAMDVLHHITNLNTAIDELHRVLKPGGRVLIFEPNIKNPLMFFAHAIPAEERLALRRSRPSALRAIMERRFSRVEWNGICELVTEVDGARGSLLTTYLRLCRASGLTSWFPRQVWMGVKLKEPR